MSLPSVYFEHQHTRSDRAIVIMCEGKDDAHFIDKICAEFNACPEKVGIIFSNGEKNITKDLSLLMKSSYFVDGTIQKIIIVRDSDNNGAKNLQDLSSHIEKIGWPPLEHAKLNAVQIGGVVREIGYFSIPSIGEEGALENLVLRSVADDDRCKRAGDVLDQQISDTGNLDKYWKRKVQIYLSLSPTHWRGAGMATKGGVFDIDHPCFNEFKDFLKIALN